LGAKAISRALSLLNPGEALELPIGDQPRFKRLTGGFKVGTE
jgi:hypothetical protein